MWVVCLSFFFFKQKTAYEMRISDWSSDVCSSDLRQLRRVEHDDAVFPQLLPERAPACRSEERRVGKECVRRVDLGGRRIIKKKNTTTTIKHIESNVIK